MASQQDSIYKYINRMLIEYPGLPYVFQDELIAGKRDVKYIFWEDSLSATNKEKLAKEVMDVVSVCLENKAEYNRLHTILEEKPVYLYISALTSRIKLLLSEKIINRDKLYSFGIMLTTESNFEEEVKLGMLVLGFFENDLTKQILKTLGYHSSFTIYAVEAFLNFAGYNELLFELLKNTCGYGKLAALILFKPISFVQQKWVFEQGALNKAEPHISAIICLEKVDMQLFYLKLKLTKKNFSKLSYLLAYAGEYNDLRLFSQSLVLVEKYMSSAKALAKSFIDLAAIVTIEKSMLSFRIEEKSNVIRKNGWVFEKQKEILNKCNKLLKQLKWKEVVLQELSMPFQKTGLILMVLERIRLMPDFHAFITILNNDLFDMDILEYVLIEHPEIYLDDVKDYLMQVLPMEIFEENPQDIKEDMITAEYKPDIWLVYLLKALRKKHQNEEKLFIRCLTSRFPEVRIEAIQALRIFKPSWSEEVFPALEHALNIEPVKSIAKRLQRLMGIKDTGPEKEQRYIDVTKAKIEPSPWDISLLATKIAGTFYRDLLVVEGCVESGDILYLVREPDNPYDSNAILVTTEDGYIVGYVPRSNNSVLASMIDAGEKLYAVLLSENLDTGKPEIKIMLSNRPKVAGRVIQFPSLRLPKQNEDY